MLSASEVGREEEEECAWVHCGDGFVSLGLEYC